MYEQYLPVFYANTDFEIADMLPEMIGQRANLSQALEFCRQWRIRGIAAYFISGVPRGLFEELDKSAQAFLYFLRYCDDDAKATSFSEPFFDAVAVQDYDCARLIANFSRTTWNPELEYEDDFLYFQFLMKHFYLSSELEECQELLNRYEDVLQGAEDPKLNICQAYLDGNQENWEEAFCAFLDSRYDQKQRLIQKGALSQEEAATEAQLNIEGLALLRFAEMKGFTTQREYIGTPSSARKHLSIKSPEDAWKKI